MGYEPPKKLHWQMLEAYRLGSRMTPQLFRSVYGEADVEISENLLGELTGLGVAPEDLAAMVLPYKEYMDYRIDVAGGVEYNKEAAAIEKSKFEQRTSQITRRYTIRYWLGILVIVVLGLGFIFVPSFVPTPIPENLWPALSFSVTIIVAFMYGVWTINRMREEFKQFTVEYWLIESVADVTLHRIQQEKLLEHWRKYVT